MIKNDNVLSEACREAAEQLAVEAEAKFRDAEPYVFSEDFEKNIDNLIRKGKMKKRRRLRIPSRLIIIAAILAIITLIFCFANLEKNQLEKPYKITSCDKYSSVESLDNRSLLYYTLFADYSVTPGYMPEGYELVQTESGDYLYAQEYKNNSGCKIMIEKSAANDVCAINTEFYSYEEMLIDDTWVIIYTSSDSNPNEYSALYYKDGMKYSVVGVLDKDVLIKMVKTLN